MEGRVLAVRDVENFTFRGFMEETLGSHSGTDKQPGLLGCYTVSIDK